MVMIKVRLTKLRESDNPLYPNNIIVGYTKEASIPEKYFSKPEVGSSFYLGSFRSSTVQEIIDDNTFRTFNSIYKWEVID